MILRDLICYRGEADVTLGAFFPMTIHLNKIKNWFSVEREGQEVERKKAGLSTSLNFELMILEADGKCRLLYKFSFIVCNETASAQIVAVCLSKQTVLSN